MIQELPMSNPSAFLPVFSCAFGVQTNPGGGAAAEDRAGVTFLRRDGDRNVHSIKSGSCKFVSQWSN
jgi:hypothetical protein